MVLRLIRMHLNVSLITSVVVRINTIHLNLENRFVKTCSLQRPLENREEHNPVVYITKYLDTMGATIQKLFLMILSM